MLNVATSQKAKPTQYKHPANADALCTSQAGLVGSHPVQAERELLQMVNRNPYQHALLSIQQAQYQADRGRQIELLQVLQPLHLSHVVEFRHAVAIGSRKVICTKQRLVLSRSALQEHVALSSIGSQYILPIKRGTEAEPVSCILSLSVHFDNMRLHEDLNNVTAGCSPSS